MTIKLLIFHIKPHLYRLVPEYKLTFVIQYCLRVNTFYGDYIRNTSIADADLLTSEIDVNSEFDV